MTISIQILKSIYTKPLTLQQLYQLIDTTTHSVRARMHTLKQRGFVVQKNGKLAITEEGKAFVDNKGAQKPKTTVQKQTQPNFDKGYNYIALKDADADQTVKLWASDSTQATKLAKLIYGSKSEVINIGQKTE